jgi:hypothetical protein
VTSSATVALCALCVRPATETIEPARRTMARGADPSDPSYSLTVILPDVGLCAEHAQDVGEGKVFVGWCDDQRCRIYGEVGIPSACGDPYKKLGPGNRT